MCNCKKDVEEKLLERFKANSPNATEHGVRLAGYAFVIGASVTQKGCMPIELTANHPLKKGGRKVKTERQNMIFSFCPFCGEKYDKESAA